MGCLSFPSCSICSSVSSDRPALGGETRPNVISAACCRAEIIRVLASSAKVATSIRFCCTLVLSSLISFVILCDRASRVSVNSFRWWELSLSREEWNRIRGGEEVWSISEDESFPCASRVGRVSSSKIGLWSDGIFWPDLEFRVLRGNTLHFLTLEK